MCKKNLVAGNCLCTLTISDIVSLISERSTIEIRSHRNVYLPLVTLEFSGRPSSVSKSTMTFHVLLCLQQKKKPLQIKLGSSPITTLNMLTCCLWWLKIKENSFFCTRGVCITMVYIDNVQATHIICCRSGGSAIYLWVYPVDLKNTQKYGLFSNEKLIGLYIFHS